MFPKRDIYPSLEVVLRSCFLPSRISPTQTTPLLFPPIPPPVFIPIHLLNGTSKARMWRRHDTPA